MSITLGSPLIYNGIKFINRVGMAPMTRNAADEKKVPLPVVGPYYAKRASGGAGLIITEGVHVNNTNTSDGTTVSQCRTPEQIAAWKSVVDQCKKASPGVIMCMQLWHIGPWATNPITPSESPAIGGMNVKVNPDGKRTKAATLAELNGVIDDFVTTGVNAVKKCGFDAVELHGAHGYFLSTFNSSFYNRRDGRDGMGSSGTMRERATYVCTLIRKMKEALGPKVPIFIRYSQWEGQDFNNRNFLNTYQLSEYLYAIQDAGINGVNVSTRQINAPAFPDEHPTRSLSAWTSFLYKQRIAGVPKECNPPRPPIVLACGGVTVSRAFGHGNQLWGEFEVSDPQPALDSLARGDFDILLIGRSMLTNPDWANKVIAGKWKELKPYTKYEFENVV